MDIASLLEVQVNEEPSAIVETVADCKNVDNSRKPSELVSPEEAEFFKRMFGDGLAKVRFRRLHCTACDVHIGSAPSETYNMQEHPILKTLLCATCREFYGDGNFEQGDDATDMFCRWCANGGNLYCCSYCSNTFCDKCIKRNFDADEQKKIEDEERWKCFVCDPKDLFTHRSVCRALMQHVRTLAKILRGDRSMSAKEMNEKIEQDDSQCCPGRRSRRRRRESISISISSDDDGQSSDRSRSPSLRRNRSKRRRKQVTLSKNLNNQKDKSAPRLSLNGTSRYLPITANYLHQLQETVPGSAKTATEYDDIPTTLLHCEQTMIEGENETVTPQGLILSANTPSKAGIIDSVLYNNAISLNPISSQNIVRGPTARGGKTIVPIRPLRKIDSLPRGATPHLIHRLPNFPGRPTAPMVSIPNRGALLNINQPKSSSISRSQKPESSTTKNTSTTEPSVIDLESDSEELIIIESSVVPLTQTEKNKQQSLMPTTADNQSTHSDKSVQTSPLCLRKKMFDDAVNNPLTYIDELLENLRERLQLDFDQAEIVPEDNEIHNARVKLKIINQNIDLIVTELAAFNNSMIRKYSSWKKNYGDEDEENSRPIILKKNEPSNKFGTLDLECVRDSETEADDLDEDDADMQYLLDFSNKLRTFIEKDTINRSTMTEVETEDKAIQAYESILTMDYDKSIGYSLLMKADYDYNRKKEVYKPVMINDEYFGKYEEQFIFYLQNFEDDRKKIDIEAENEKSLLGEASLLELIDADIGGKFRECHLKKTSNISLNKKKLKGQELTVITENAHKNQNNEKLMEIDEKQDEEITDPLNKSYDTSVKDSSDVLSDSSSQDDAEAKLSSCPGNDKTEKSITTVSDLIKVGASPLKLISSFEERIHQEAATAVQALIEDHNELAPILTSSLKEKRYEKAATVIPDLTEDENELETKLTPSQEAKHEETVIAVRTLINEESNDIDKWKNNVEDECAILD